MASFDKFKNKKKTELPEAVDVTLDLHYLNLEDGHTTLALIVMFSHESLDAVIYLVSAEFMEALDKPEPIIALDLESKKTGEVIQVGHIDNIRIKEFLNTWIIKQGEKLLDQYESITESLGEVTEKTNPLVLKGTKLQ